MPHELLHPFHRFMMSQTRYKLALLLILCFTISLTHAQTKKGELATGKSITSEITPTETHLYTLFLEKDQIAFFKLMQMGVDMKITTYDADGEKIEDLDSPNGANGPEHFTISSPKKGRYVIEVSPFDENEPSGRYELVVEAIKFKPTTPNELTDEIFASWDNNNEPGLVVAIIKDGAVVYNKGYGMANLEYDIPIESSTVFDVGSLSKQFTGFAISYLIEQGEISPDDDIRDYIPEFPDFGYTVTIDHLIHHTSGLRDWPGALSMKGQVFGNVISFDDILSMAYHQKELNFIPGSEHLYSSTGYCVLAELVQRVSGISFRQWTETHIFQPLGMHHTHFHDEHTEIVKNKANGYFYEQEAYHLSSNNLTALGSSSLYTTIDDLVKWANNIMNPKAGHESIVNRMFQVGMLNDGTQTSYGFGLYIGEYNGIKKISHTGSWASFKSYSGYFPDENFSIIILSNNAVCHPEVIGDEITDIYLNETYPEEFHKDGAEPKEAEKAESIERLTPTQISGAYEIYALGRLEINAKNDSIQVFQSWNRVAYTMMNAEKNTYEIPDVPALQFVFSELKDDLAQTLTIYENGAKINCKRIEKIDFSKIKLDDFTGTFYSEELSTTYHFVVANDKLVAKHGRISDFNLNPLKTDIFNGEAWFFGQVQFVRDANGGVTGCKVSNDYVRNVYFEKIN